MNLEYLTILNRHIISTTNFKNNEQCIGLLLCNTFNQIEAVIKKRNILIMILTLDSKQWPTGLLSLINLS